MPFHWNVVKLRPSPLNNTLTATNAAIEKSHSAKSDAGYNKTGNESAPKENKTSDMEEKDGRVTELTLHNDSEEVIIDELTPFHISPDHGALPPGGTMQFTIVFAPPAVSSYHNVLHLVLSEIMVLPDPSLMTSSSDLMRRSPSLIESRQSSMVMPSRQASRQPVAGTLSG